MNIKMLPKISDELIQQTKLEIYEQAIVEAKNILSKTNISSADLTEEIARHIYMQMISEYQKVIKPLAKLLSDEVDYYLVGKRFGIEVDND